jgi:putative ABC transport system substrate-binding protein
MEGNADGRRTRPAQLHLTQSSPRAPWQRPGGLRNRSNIPCLIPAHSVYLSAVLLVGGRMLFDRLRRREFLTLLGGAAVTRPGTAVGQISSRRPLIAFLSGTSALLAAKYVSAFTLGLQERGYVEGRDINVAFRYASGDLTRQSVLVDELFQLQPNVFVTGSTAATIAVRRVTASIPIVCAALTDPIGLGLVVSHARPGGNVTGVLNNLDSLPGKRLELARELIHGGIKFGMLVNTNNESNAVQRQDALAAASLLGVQLVPAEVQSAAEIERALEMLAREHVEFVFILQDPMFNNEGRRIAAIAVALRLATMHGFRENVEDGGLVSYGINMRENFRRAADFVDKILKGNSPGDLPVELPTKEELVINLKTAKALGLAIPESFLIRIDEVIE